MQFISAELVREPDAAPLLAHVEEDTRALAVDPLEGGLELLAAIAALGAEHVPREALRMHPDEPRASAGGALDECDVMVSVHEALVHHDPERPEAGRKPRYGHPLDEPLVEVAIPDQVPDRDQRQLVASGEAQELPAVRHPSVRRENLAEDARGGEPGEANQVERGFGVPGAAEDAFVRGA